MKGFLFELGLKAGTQRADRHVLSQCGTDDQTLKDLLRAEYLKRDVSKMTEELREGGDTKTLKHATHLLREAEQICQELLREWQPAQGKQH